MAKGDFHLHSTASDGVQSPTWVIETAAANGVEVCALTDHDSTAGLSEASVAAEKAGLALIPGIEISVTHGENDVHLLGLAFDPGHVELQQFLGGQRDGRTGRAARIVEKLASSGVALELDRVMAIAGDASVGRPHVARALVETGHAESVQHAFDTWLGDGQPGYVGRDRLDASEAIALIHRAGGAAIAAHPDFIAKEFEPVIEEFVAYGLDGIETYYKHYDSETVGRISALAQRLGLARSGGSDYHGLGNPNDRAIGEIPFPGAAVDRFLDWLAANTANTRLTGAQHA